MRLEAELPNALQWAEHFRAECSGSAPANLLRLRQVCVGLQKSQTLEEVPEVPQLDP